ncbi:MAG: oligosaccharide flippase family protein [Nitrososphaerota archaeon]
MSGSIRVRLSGILMFVGNLVTLLTGLIFNILIARNLQPAALGAWFLIGSIIPYFQVLEKAIPYWAGREIPRGRQVGKTTLTFNILISLPITIVFILLSNTLASIANIQPRTILLASLFIPTYYAAAALTSITYSTAPHRLGLRTIIIDGVKIPLALILLPLGLEGVMIAVIIGNTVYITYLYKTSQDQLEKRIDTAWLRQSLKKSWLPVHETLIGYLSAATDSLIIGLLLTMVDLSQYGIALAIASVVGMGKSLTGAIYPKLLKAGTATPDELKALFKFQHIFITPMVAGGIALAPQLITIFGAKYLPAATILPLLLLSPALGITSLTMRTVITGIEKADKKTNNRGLLKSPLFTTQLPGYLYAASLILITTTTVRDLGIMGAAIARLAASAISFIPMCILYSRIAPLSTILHGLKKTVPASIVMSVLLLLINPRGSLYTIAAVGLGACIYFATLFIIDRDSRALAVKTINEAKKLLMIQANST